VNKKHILDEMALRVCVGRFVRASRFPLEQLTGATRDGFALFERDIKTDNLLAPGEWRRRLQASLRANMAWLALLVGPRTADKTAKGGPRLMANLGSMTSRVAGLPGGEVATAKCIDCRGAASVYAQRGLASHPLGPDPDGYPKKPQLIGWQRLTPDDNLRHDWSRAYGLGLVLGAASGNLAASMSTTSGWPNTFWGAYPRQPISSHGTLRPKRRRGGSPQTMGARLFLLMRSR
jgi:hypothetical protein